MKSALSVFVAVMAGQAFASGSLEIMWITPENAEELGFELEIYREGDATEAAFTGPLSLNDGCVPKQSGAALTDASDRTLALHMAYFEPGNTRPTALAAYTNSGHTMSVWIDYFCPSGRELESRRYAIESIADFLSQQEE